VCPRRNKGGTSSGKDFAHCLRQDPRRSTKFARTENKPLNRL